MSISNQVGKVGSDGAVSGHEFLSGYRQVEAEILAVPEHEVLRVNLDVPSAVATVLGALPEIEALRGELSGIASFDLARFDRLRQYALALGHAHAVYRAAAGANDGVAELAEQVASIRELLHLDAMAQAKRGLMTESSVAKLKSGLGYKNLAFDVLSLVSLFRQHAAAISGRTAVQASELETAERLAHRLVTSVGLCEQAPATVGTTAITRQKAFTLFLKAYDDARRAVHFLRWHQNDADSIMPSLYAGRGGRPSKSETPSTPAATPGPGSAGATGSAGGTGGASAAEAENSDTTAPGGFAASESAVAVGLPGAAPFTH